MSLSATLEVWDCRKCASIRSAPCGGVCLPADDVSRESTRPLSTHQSTHHAWVTYVVSLGYDRDVVEQMTTRELVAMFGSAQ